MLPKNPKTQQSKLIVQKMAEGQQPPNTVLK